MTTSAARALRTVSLGQWARPIALGMVAAGALAVVWAMWFATSNGATADFGVYQASVARWLAGGGLYHPGQLEGPYILSRSGMAVFDYPPPAAFLIAPIAWLGYVPFTVLSVLALYAGLLRIAGPTPMKAGAIALLALTPQFAFAVFMGNVTIALAALLAWGYIGRAGIAGAIGVVVKLTSGAIAGLDGLRGMAIAGALAAAAALITLPIVGLGSWSDYAVAMGNARPECGAAIAVGCWASPTVALALGAGLTLACLLTASRIKRLALVTAALLVTSMELTPLDPRWVYLVPLLVAVFTGLPIDPRRPSGQGSAPRQ